MSEKTSNILVTAIQEQSNQEALAILQRAEKEAQRITYKAAESADVIRSEILGRADHQASLVRQKIMSKVNLFIQKKNREEMEIFIKQIFQHLKQKLNDMKEFKEYPQVLDSLVMEGIPVMDSDQIVLIPGKTERKLLSGKRLKDLQTKVNQKFKRNIQLTLSEETLDEGGVILMSDEGRFQFDNRFSARIQRMENKLRMIAVSEIEVNQNLFNNKKIK